MKRWFSIVALLFFSFCAQAFVLPAPIQAKLELFRKSSSPAMQARLRKMESLIQRLENLQIPTAEQALAASDLQNTAELQKILRYSKGVVGLSDLQNLKIAQGFSLGLSAQSGIYEMLSERFELIPWTVAYPHFGIDWNKVKNHTEVFLRKVQKTGSPVVFFVPNKTISYSGKSITVDELKWLLLDNRRLQNAYFVFGAYDLITPELEQAWADAGFSSDEFRALFLRALGAESSSYDQAI